MPPVFRLITRWGIVVFLILRSASSFAFNETLSFRLTSLGTIEAVVSGLSNKCYIQFEPPNSVLVSGNTIVINSPYTYEYICGVPPPGNPYEVVANLGKLIESTYQVTWYQAMGAEPLMVSATLVPGALTPVSVPALSWPSLVVLALGVAFVATWPNRKKHRPRV